MKAYNRIMEMFWLAMGVVILIVVTYQCIAEGFGSWGAYYAFAAMALLTFGMRRFMRKRMEKHMKYLEEETEKTKQ